MILKPSLVTARSQGGNLPAPLPGEYGRLCSMRKKRTVLLVLGCIVAVVALAGGVWWHFLRGQDGGGGKPNEMRSLAALAERMEGIAASGALTLEPPGEITYENTIYPITMLSRRQATEEGVHVLLTGGIHGNEPAGTEFLLRFAEILATKKDAWPGISVDIVPVVNPWGWVHGARRNGNGCDLNREFATFEAPESVLMQTIFKRKRYDLIVDLHEDGHVGGFYCYRLANPDEALCRSMIKFVRDAGLPVHDGRVMTIFHAQDGIITSPLWTLRLARAIHQLSMSNYFRLEGCPQAFLFESPKRLPLEERVTMHGAALKVLLESLKNPGR